MDSWKYFHSQKIVAPDASKDGVPEIDRMKSKMIKQDAQFEYPNSTNRWAHLWRRSGRMFGVAWNWFGMIVYTAGCILLSVLILSTNVFLGIVFAAFSCAGIHYAYRLMRNIHTWQRLVDEHRDFGCVVTFMKTKRSTKDLGHFDSE